MKFSEAYKKPYNQQLIYRLWLLTKTNENLVMINDYGIKERLIKSKHGILSFIIM